MQNSYFFRDPKEAEEPLPLVRNDLGIIKTQLRDAEDFEAADDAFCLIRDEEKHFLESCGIRNVKISDDPLRIVDNHFCIPMSTSLYSSYSS